ncbi:MAG TPA: dihydropteroate synthase [Symbiobacteriaceae bacterium]
MAHGAYRARLLTLSTLEELRQELTRLGVHRGGIPIMAAKGVLRLIRVDQIPTPAANIIKQEILARGGDLATPRSAAAFSEPRVDVIFIGSLTTLRSTISKLYRQRVYDLPAIADAVQQVLIRTTPGYLPVARHHSLPAAVAEEILDDLAGGRIPAEPDRRATGLPTLLPVEGREWQFGTQTYVVVTLPPSGTPEGVSASLSSTALEADVLMIEADGPSPQVPEAVSEAVRHLRTRCPGTPVAVRTSRGAVAEAALAAGAAMLHLADSQNEEVLRAAAGSEALLIISHRLTETMEDSAGPAVDAARPVADAAEWVEGDLLSHIAMSFDQALSAAAALGLREEQIILDPGLGPDKTPGQNRAVLRRLRELTSLGRPLLVEPARIHIPTLRAQGPDCDAAGACAALSLAVAGGADFVVIPDRPDLMAAVRSADWLIRQASGSRSAQKSIEGKAVGQHGSR